MKKFNLFVGMLLAFVLLFTFAACTGGGLSVPSGITFSEENVMRWDTVENARSYRIEIKRHEDGTVLKTDVSRKTEYSLDNLEEGDYDIRIMAVGGSQNSLSSKWSKSYAFEKKFESGLVYSLINNNSEYEVTRYGKATGDVVVDDVYRGKPVTSIGKSAFQNANYVTSVTVGNNVRSIGEEAFYNCLRLESVTVPETVTSLGENLFFNCKALKSFEFPENVQIVPAFAFAYCSGLQSIDLGNVLLIDENAFYGCNSLASVVIPDTVLDIGTGAFSTTSTNANENKLKSVKFGSGLLAIEESAFYDCRGLTDLEFSEESSLAYIGRRAFGNCTALAEVGLPDGLEEIDAYAFSDCASLETVEVPESLTRIGLRAFSGTKLYLDQEQAADSDGAIYVGDWLIDVTAPVKNTVTDLAYESYLWGDLVDGRDNGEPEHALRLKDTTVGIAAQAFLQAGDLRNVNLPKSLRYLCDYSFWNCPKLYSVIVPAESLLESIGRYAFTSCTSLSNVRLCQNPNSSEGNALKSIGEYAFYGCTNLDNNTYNPAYLVPDSVESIGAYAFMETRLWEKAAETQQDVNSREGKGIVYAGNWVVGINAEGLNSSEVTLGEEVIGISDYAFMGSPVENVSGTSVRNIGIGAFMNCTSLLIVRFGNDLRTIKDYTFFGCSGLLSMTFPRRLTSIGRGAFYNCFGLSTVDLSACDRLTEIGINAFNGCSSLAELDFPEDGVLETIGDNAFYLCSSLRTIVIPDSVKTIGSRAFARGYVRVEVLPGMFTPWTLALTNLTSVTLGSGLETIGLGAFSDAVLLTSIRIPDSVKTIGSRAFFRCTRLKDVVIGSGVETIGDAAFYGCSALEHIEIPATVKTVGDHAFRKSGLTYVALHSLDYVGSHAFYGDPGLTVYTDAEGDGSWSGTWNSSFRPEIWNASFDAEEGYVVSVTVSANSIFNPFARYGIAAPYRAGYEFLGWSLTEGSETAEISADEIGQYIITEETTLYSVWEVAEPGPDAPVEDTYEDAGGGTASDPGGSFLPQIALPPQENPAD